MGCTFCSTGTMGLRGDLTAGEIVEQIVHAKRHVPAIKNVVFMVGKPRLLFSFRVMLGSDYTSSQFCFSPCDLTHRG